MQIGEIRPVPTPEEFAAIVAALQHVDSGRHAEVPARARRSRWRLASRDYRSER